MRSSVAFPLPAARPEPGSGRGDSHPLAALFVPLENLLVDGGDGRLTVSPHDQLNAYGCRAFPRPAAHDFASSTASTISERAYAQVERARTRMIAEALHAGIDCAFDARLEAIRQELRDMLGLSGQGIEVVLAPSGTDAQLYALWAARAVLRAPITNVIVAADQTGSGTAFTAHGCHFSKRTALNVAIPKGEAIAGLADDLESVRIDLGDEAGERRDVDALDAAVEQAVERAVAQGRRVVLQAMDRSKFGWRAPSQNCLKTICARWPHAVQVVIDACQARLSGARIAAYLERGYIVLVTGSKFFSGPPFSGAMLVPPHVSTALAASVLAPGLRDYTARSEWPQAWPRLRAQLSNALNFGLWLRWEAALAEMGAYFAVPQAARRALLERFSIAVKSRVAVSPSLHLLREQEPDAGDDLDDQEMGTQTIFSFLLRRNGQLLAPERCADIYRALHCDVSASLPASAAPSVQWLAGQICHIGQPVALPQPGGVPTAALRISASARLVSECFSADPFETFVNLEHRFDQVSVTLEKIEMLIAHLPDISKGTP